ncbi:unnamed protein product [Caenorhabditis auriculariae]|uniref:Uncharacterized protein n=1 Tax=Caenorhabditis auriculariae TaxID=2777116 RepID=A0A8S1HE68_9PELO|nr:unnamed protein product [Caenorhabditis auriculariae]
MRRTTWLLAWLLLAVPPTEARGTSSLPEHYEISQFILSRYNRGMIPKRLQNESIKVFFSMELYQIIEVRWVDVMLGWDPLEFSNVTELMIPHQEIWLPDTTLYNSLVMSDEDTRRLMQAKLTTRGKDKGALVELLYPTIYKLSCLLNLRFFPFDVQTCRLHFGSWTYDNTLIDYFAHNVTHAIGTANCIENEGWNEASVVRHENKYECCPNNYTLLEFRLMMQRKPLYYIINLITPTSIITLISIVGFFSSSSINEPREEKITLGITTLLSMSILIFMVSDKMPSTSSFIPLIGWFYTAMIMLISLSTLCSSVVIYVQKRGILGKPPTQKTMRLARVVSGFIRMEMPLLMKQAYAQKAREEKLRRQECRKQSLWTRVYKLAREQAATRKTSSSSQKYNGVSMEKLENGGGTVANARKCCTISTDVTCISEGGLASMGPVGGLGGVALASDDDADISLPDAELLRPARPIHKASTTGSFDSVLRQVEVPVSPRSVRNLAELEWDWLAACLERVFLIVFIIIFILTAIGINLIGFFYWWMAPDTVLV